MTLENFRLHEVRIHTWKHISTTKDWRAKNHGLIWAASGEKLDQRGGSRKASCSGFERQKTIISGCCGRRNHHNFWLTSLEEKKIQPTLIFGRGRSIDYSNLGGRRCGRSSRESGKWRDWCRNTSSLRESPPFKIIIHDMPGHLFMKANLIEEDEPSQLRSTLPM